MLELPEPLPRMAPARYQQLEWPSGRVVQLATRTEGLKVDLVEMIERRESRRTFLKMDEPSLGEFLWLACRNRWSRESEYGPDQESRAHPSAGAMHPIHLLLARDATALQRYDPIAHALVEVPNSAAGAKAALEASHASLGGNQGVTLALVAEPGKTEAKYEHPETLVWRDAGVVLGYLSLIAECMGLAFCPLGITGHLSVVPCLPADGRLVGAGLAVLGRRANC